MTILCRSCGTEVEGDALFCPACGEPISAASPELPPAPDWPEPAQRGAARQEPEASEEPASDAGDEGRAPAVLPEATPAQEPPQADVARAVDEGPDSQSAEPVAADQPEDDAQRGGANRDAISTAPPSVPPWRRGAALRGSQGEAESAPPPPPDDTGTSGGAEPPAGSPVRPQAIAGAPATLSGWLIGGGAAVGIVALFLPWIGGGGSWIGRWGLAYAINYVVLIALVAMAAIVFVADTIPTFPRRNLAILAVALIGVGIGLDRATQIYAGMGAVIFLLAMIAAAAGALIVELDMDRPVGSAGGPQA